MLLPGAIDNNIVRHASRSKFGELMEAGGSLYSYTRNGTPGIETPTLVVRPSSVPELPSSSRYT